MHALAPFAPLAALLPLCQGPGPLALHVAAAPGLQDSVSLPTVQGAAEASGEAPDPEEWRRRLIRDRRLGFGPGGGDRAAMRLSRVELPADERAVALLAVGASGVLSERPRLASWAADAPLEERQAAILALGELARARPEPLGKPLELLNELALAGEAGVGDLALLALLRSGDPRGREVAERLVRNPAHPLTNEARALLAFADAPDGSTPSPAAVRLLDLRWLAAREYGTVEGRSWRSARASELLDDPRFLRAVVLAAASGVRRRGVPDHLLELLLEEAEGGDEESELGGEDVVQACVRAFPKELDEMVAAGLWKPVGVHQWNALLEAASEYGVASLMPRTLERAATVREVAPTAAAALLRRDARYLELISAAFDAPEPELRRRAALAVADAVEQSQMQSLERLESDADPGVRATALVARIRLGDDRARRAMRAQLEPSAVPGQADRPARRVLLEALGAAGRFPRVIVFIEEVLPDLDGEELGLVLPALRLRGRVVDEDLLRVAFLAALPDGSSALALAQALGTFASRSDLDFLSEQFPADASLEVNVAIAAGLVSGGHPDSLPILQQAVWKGTRNVSALAAVVVQEAHGQRLLMQWIARPPASATSTDIRRLGFAIGEWGGMDALADLARRLGGGAERPALQGAALGALTARTH